VTGRDELVKTRIEECRGSGDGTLDLRGIGLGVVPDKVFGLSQLENLFLQHNNIHVIPERIRELSKLKRLELTDNPIEKVPDIPGLILDWPSYIRCRGAVSPENIAGLHFLEVGYWQVKAHLLSIITALPGLREVQVQGRGPSFVLVTALAELLQHIGKLNQLESLSLREMQLSEIPLGIRDLKNLRYLRLENLGPQIIPGWISELSELEILVLAEIGLQTLPTSLASLHGLRALFVHENEFSEIPEVVFQLPFLRSLYIRAEVRKGRIKEIPAVVLNLKRLEKVDTYGQPIETPPPEVVAQGVAAIKNYWRQRQEAGVDYLCEAKLLIVGESGAGKTTLARKLLDRNCMLDPAETSTEGIEVTHWSFPASVRVNRDGAEISVHRDFRTNIWDFGGQEVYHATHQFFLTRRSLYVLVADDRKEDTDFNYWLQVVELLSAGSPLLIVQNEKQERRRDIDFGALRARFPNLLGTYRTNLATNRGLPELARAIQAELERLPHIGVALPATWKRVRDKLERDESDYIGVDEYLAICQENGFTRREDKLQLSGYLHDLGICLHFQDDPVLKNTVILKPKWGTDAAYRILDDHAVVERRGRFGSGDLDRAWFEEAYAPMRDELLKLMMKFQLCYKLPETEEYIAPQLLSLEQPGYEWPAQGSLVLRYEYEFMPKGLVTRLIVALHHRIAAQMLVWRTGAVFERDSSRAEVIEDYSRRRITVRAKGPDARGLVAIVDDRLEDIHRSFPRLKYERQLSCSCPVCQQSEQPGSYSLTVLKRFAQAGHKIQCQDSFELVEAAALIWELFPGALARPAVEGRELDRIQKEVFISYFWMGKSKAIAGQIEKALLDHGVAVRRDQTAMRYRDSIREFMERIGRGKAIVVVLSKGYLESKNCMFELMQIAARGDIRKRVFPIVLEDACVSDAIARIGYIQFWEKKSDQLSSAMKGIRGEHLDGLRKELDLFTKIRASIDGLATTLGDMNALTAERHRDSNFQELLAALEARLMQ
jgi:internalin A